MLLIVDSTREISSAVEAILRGIEEIISYRDSMQTSKITHKLCLCSKRFVTAIVRAARLLLNMLLKVLIYLRSSKEFEMLPA